jgi:hypothetical protein
MSSDNDPANADEKHGPTGEGKEPELAERPAARPSEGSAAEKAKPTENKVVRLLEKNPLGMTLPEMAGGPRQVKKIRLLRPLLAEAIRLGLVMPVSQRAGNTVYRLVKFLGPR